MPYSGCPRRSRLRSPVDLRRVGRKQSHTFATLRESGCPECAQLPTRPGKSSGIRPRVSVMQITWPALQSRRNRQLMLHCTSKTCTPRIRAGQEFGTTQTACSVHGTSEQSPMTRISGLLCRVWPGRHVWNNAFFTIAVLFVQSAARKVMPDYLAMHKTINFI